MMLTKGLSVQFPIFSGHRSIRNFFITRHISSKRSLNDIMEEIREVDIDPRGKFKYIQIKVSDGTGREKLIVRGYKDCGYHADILERVQSQLKNFKCECPGGGRIHHQSEEKKMMVYGYSMGFGRADHQVTVDLLKKYPDYTIDWSNEGY